MTAVLGRFEITEKLKEWLRLKEWTNKKFAEELRPFLSYVDETLVSRWLSSERIPTQSQQAAICWVTGLDVGDYITFKRKKQ